MKQLRKASRLDELCDTALHRQPAGGLDLDKCALAGSKILLYFLSSRSRRQAFYTLRHIALTKILFNWTISSLSRVNLLDLLYVMIEMDFFFFKM